MAAKIDQAKHGLLVKSIMMNLSTDNTKEYLKLFGFDTSKSAITSLKSRMLKNLQLEKITLHQTPFLRCKKCRTITSSKRVAQIHELTEHYLKDLHYDTYTPFILPKKQKIKTFLDTSRDRKKVRCDLCSNTKGAKTNLYTIKALKIHKYKIHAH